MSFWHQWRTSRLTPKQDIFFFCLKDKQNEETEKMKSRSNPNIIKQPTHFQYMKNVGRMTKFSGRDGS